MRVHLGCDHAGFELKEHFLGWLREHGHNPVDHGPSVYNELDDYPAYCIAAASAVMRDPGSLGVVIGGSGNGEAIAANKVTGVRAALAWSVETARLGRLHNDANVLSIGARMHTEQEATGFLAEFLGTAFSAEVRHVRRIDQLHRFEQERG
jgi:ribose 5-phosphate isomerase B